LNWLFSQSRTWTTNVTLWSFLPTAGEKMAIPTCSRSLVGTYRGKSKDRCCPGGTWEVWTGLEEGSVLEAWETFEEKGQGLETHLAYSIWLSFWFLSWYLCHKFVLVFQLLLFLFLIVMEPFFSYWFCLLFFVKLLFSFLVASFCLFCENCTLISVRVLLTRLLIFIVSLPSKTQLEKFFYSGSLFRELQYMFSKDFRACVSGWTCPTTRKKLWSSTLFEYSQAQSLSIHVSFMAHFHPSFFIVWLSLFKQWISLYVGGLYNSTRKHHNTLNICRFHCNENTNTVQSLKKCPGCKVAPVTNLFWGLWPHVFHYWLMCRSRTLEKF